MGSVNRDNRIIVVSAKLLMKLWKGNGGFTVAPGGGRRT